MATASETAEAILIVIKRIAKWILVAAIALMMLVGSLLLYANIKRHQQNALENKVMVFPNEKNEACDAGRPYFYLVVNDGDKVVEKVEFAVEIRRRGFSTALNSYTSLTEDAILKPKQAYGRCYGAINADHSGPIQETDVDIVVKWKFVTFAD